MKQLFVFLCLFTLLAGPAFAQTHSQNTPLEWYTDLTKAYEKSQATKKPIFGFFTGSDWCGWCHKLQNDVFSKTAFVKWAKDKVILLELDFPRRKQLPAELAQQNANLQQAFQVAGYPTIWIFTAVQDKATKNFSLNPLGSLGYPAGSEAGKEEVKFLNDANAILAKATTPSPAAKK